MCLDVSWEFAQDESSGKLRTKPRMIVVGTVEKVIETPEAGLEQENLGHPCQRKPFFPIAGDQKLCSSVRAGCTHPLSL